MTTPELPPLPEPARRSGEQMCYDGYDKAFFDCYDCRQMHAYALAYAAQCLEASKVRNEALQARIEELESVGRRVTDAFRVLGQTTSYTREGVRARHECEASMLALDDVCSMAAQKGTA